MHSSEPNTQPGDFVARSESGRAVRIVRDVPVGAYLTIGLALFVPALGAGLGVWRESHAQTQLLTEVREEARAFRAELAGMAVVDARVISVQSLMQRDIEKLDGRVTNLEAAQRVPTNSTQSRPPYAPGRAPDGN